MALAPIVFSTLGAIGVAVYLLNPNKRNNKTSKAFLYYFASIISLWIGFEIGKNQNDLFIRILAFILMLFGIYGFLFGGVYLFNLILEEKNNDINDFNLSTSSTSSTSSNSSTSSTSIKNNTKKNDPNILLHIPPRTGKDWYLIGDKIYNKTFPGEFEFILSKDKNKLITLKNDDYDYEFYIKKTDIDEIQYNLDKAITECPYCKQKCRCLVMKQVEVLCPTCNNKWIQNFDIRFLDKY